MGEVVDMMFFFYVFWWMERPESKAHNFFNPRMAVLGLWLEEKKRMCRETVCIGDLMKENSIILDTAGRFIQNQQKYEPGVVHLSREIKAIDPALSKSV